MELKLDKNDIWTSIGVILLILLVVLLILGCVHFSYWLIAKGIIWVAITLFSIDWYAKFWAVYVGVFVISSLFGTRTYYSGK